MHSRSMYFGGGARGCIAEAKNTGVALARYAKRHGVGLPRRTYRENIQAAMICDVARGRAFYFGGLMSVP